MTILVLLLASLLIISKPDSAEPQAGDLVAQALDAGRIDDAIGLLTRAVTTDAKNPAALAWLGSAQVRKGGQVPPMEGAGWVKRGFDALDEAVERLNLGLAQKKAGRPTDARAAWETGRRLYPAAAEAAAIDRELKGL